MFCSNILRVLNPTMILQYNNIEHLLLNSNKAKSLRRKYRDYFSNNKCLKFYKIIICMYTMVRNVKYDNVSNLIQQ